MARDANSGERPQSDYQVFLSFRGCDTRQGFTDSLYHFLTDAGIRVFRDNEELRPGNKIKEVLAAINKSIVCIPILSQNYANSKWCLFELAEMVRLEKDIMPIFYKVEADDVKLKTELYSDHLSKFGKEYDAEREEWERALKEVGGIFDKSQLEGSFKEVGRIKAWTIMDYPGHGELCKQVVSEVLSKLEVKHKVLEGPLVGVDGHVQDIKRLLCIGTSDVRFVVIHGVGGVGKTTLAKAIFNELCKGFHYCCFLNDVRETTKHYGLVHLQNVLLRAFCPRTRDVLDTDSGIKKIKDIVKNKKVLIVLDDLDKCKQIESLAGDSTWFYSGSRIIVTTRDRSCVFKHPQVWDYNMSEMSPEHALQLFCQHAFKMESPPIDYLHISKMAIASCGRLPLAIEIMGSYLHYIDKEHWKSKIKTIASHRDVREKLLISYKTLDSRTKEIFLDIACFFVRKETRHAVYMWEACDFHPDEGIECLLSMSLVKISEDNTFWMHELVRDLGREIVIQENLKRPERRSRLWSRNKIERVLSRGKGTSDIDAILLVSTFEDKDGFGSSNSPVTANHIKPLQNLRFLELYLIHIEGDFKDALQDLKWFTWHGMGNFYATNLELKDVIVLDLSCSMIQPDLLETIKIGKHLKFLNLSKCLSKSYGCDLVLPEALGNLSSLVELDVSSRDVKRMPKSIGNLKNLRLINMNSSGISMLPSSIGDLEMLEELHAANSALEYIPEDIRRLRQLRILGLSNSKIYLLPSTIDELPLLQHLLLEGCDRIRALPNLPSSLTILRVSSKMLRKLPNLLNLKLLSQLFLRGNIYAMSLMANHLSSEASWINSCPSLETFKLAFRSITCIHMETAAFPHLKQLQLCCPDLKVIGQLPLSLTALCLSAIIAGVSFPTCLREMEALTCLELSQCRFTGELLLPRHLKTLLINRCSLPQPTIDLSGLKMLQHLAITNCEELVAVRGVEKMELLEKVTVLGCRSLKEISSLSKFQRLVVSTDDDELFRGIKDIITKDLVRYSDMPPEVNLEAINDDFMLDLLFY